MRERCNVIKEKAKLNQLSHFDVDMSKFDDTASFVVGLIKVRTLPNLQTSIYAHN